jgi:Ca2+/Na+ antiporter
MELGFIYNLLYSELKTELSSYSLWAKNEPGRKKTAAFLKPWQLEIIITRSEHNAEFAILERKTRAHAAQISLRSLLYSRTWVWIEPNAKVIASSTLEVPLVTVVRSEADKDKSKEEMSSKSETKHRDSVDMSRKAEPTFMEGAREMALGGQLNILLLCTPVALISWGAKWPEECTFIFSLLAIAPCAERLGFVTEQLAFHTNETVGGLLNATFGNATELIVAIAALSKGLYTLVQLSLLGSILSNLLLVLGTAFLCGGYHHKTQYFGKISSQVNGVLLMLATMALMLPSVLVNTGTVSSLNSLGFSRFEHTHSSNTHLTHTHHLTHAHITIHTSPNSHTSPTTHTHHITHTHIT